MSINDLNPLYQNLLDSLPNFVREQVELCLFHNDSTYMTTLVGMDLYNSDEILKSTICAIAEIMLSDEPSMEESRVEEINGCCFSPDCKC